MVDLIPVALTLFGLLSIVKPEYVLLIDRWQRSLGTDKSPTEIELPEMAYVLTRALGVVFAIIGGVFTFQSL